MALLEFTLTNTGRKTYVASKHIVSFTPPETPDNAEQPETWVDLLLSSKTSIRVDGSSAELRSRLNQAGV